MASSTTAASIAVLILSLIVSLATPAAAARTLGAATLRLSNPDGFLFGSTQRRHMRSSVAAQGGVDSALIAHYLQATTLFSGPTATVRRLHTPC